MNRLVIGAGRKTTQTCDVYTIWDEIFQFYDKPFYDGETKRDIPIYNTILDKNKKYVVHSMLGETRDKRSKVQQFMEECKLRDIKYEWGNLIHQTAVFTNPKHIGEDVIIRPLSIICSNTVLGDHADIGNLCNIGHDSIIGDYSVVAGQVAMSGGVTLGEGVFIGQGASIKPDIQIGEGAVIGTGAVVTKDIPPNMVVAGNPARGNPKFRGASPW